MQLFYNRSDRATEDMLYGVESVRRFAGLRLAALPDETTMLNFGARGTASGEALLSAINASLASRAV